MDATNVADGVVCVITPVDIDHQHFLGSSVEQIATEKAGIIKADAIAVSAVQVPEVGSISPNAPSRSGRGLSSRAATSGALARGGPRWAAPGVEGPGGEYPEVFLPLHGVHQASNAVALAAVEAFVGGANGRCRRTWCGPASPRSPRRGGWRWCDARQRSSSMGSQPCGARSPRAAVTESFDFTRLVGVLAVFADKDAYGILDELQSVFDEVVVTGAPRHERWP